MASVRIEEASLGQARRLFREMAPGQKLSQFKIFLCHSSRIWVGYIDDQLVCAFGLVPVSMIGDQGYIWLYVTDAIKGRGVTFLRQVRGALAGLMELYPRLIGEVVNGDSRAIRWLTWCGAEFGRPGPRLTPFMIRKVQ